MRIEDIQGVNDLIKYIKLELAHNTNSGKRRIELNLPERLFFKMIKLIQFYIKDNQAEPYRSIDIPQTTERFFVKINNIQTWVQKK